MEVNSSSWQLHLISLLPPGSCPPAPLPTPQRHPGSCQQPRGFIQRPPGPSPRPGLRKSGSDIAWPEAGCQRKAPILWEGKERTPLEKAEAPHTWTWDDFASAPLCESCFPGNLSREVRGSLGFLDFIYLHGPTSQPDVPGG